MNTPNKIGANLQGGDDDARKEAARLMGSVTSEKKRAAARETAAKREGKTYAEFLAAKLGDPDKAQELAAESRRKQAEGQRRRWEEYHRQQASTSTASEPKRGRGRPAKAQPEATEPKRGRGRPKKSETVPTAQTTTEAP